MEVRPTAELGFLDRRGVDLSMDPGRFLARTGFEFTPMEDCFKAFKDAAWISA